MYPWKPVGQNDLQATCKQHLWLEAAHPLVDINKEAEELQIPPKQQFLMIMNSVVAKNYVYSGGDNKEV